MKHYFLMALASSLATPLYAMKAETLQEFDEQSSIEGEPLSERMAYLADHFFDGDPSEEELLKRGIDSEVIMVFDADKKKSSLFCAVLDNDTATIKAILTQENARELVNEATESGWTPLHAAAALDRLDTIQDLLAMGAAVNPHGDSNFSPLHWAAGIKHDGKAVIILLNAGANPSLARDEDGATPLHLAQTKGAIEPLLKAGVDIEARDKQGRTPVYNAVHDRISEALTALCAAGADLEARDHNGILAMSAGPVNPLIALFSAAAETSAHTQEQLRNAKTIKQVAQTCTNMDPEFRKLVFDCWQPQHKKRIDAGVRKMLGFKE